MTLKDPKGSLPKWITNIVKLANNIIQPIVTVVYGIVEDFKNYDKYNESEEKVFSSYYFSSYKGTLVIKTPFDASFSFGFIGLSRIQQESDTLNHEYGHKVQLDNMGWGAFIADVAVPSVTANILQRIGKLPYDYYGSPWEAEADMLGSVNRKENNTPWPEDAYDSYFDLLKMFWE